MFVEEFAQKRAIGRYQHTADSRGVRVLSLGALPPRPGERVGAVQKAGGGAVSFTLQHVFGRST